MDISVSDFQMGIACDFHRFITVNAGRRVGKTVAGILKLIQVATEAKSGSDIAVVSKNNAQLKSVWLKGIRDFFPAQYIEKTNLSDMTVTLVNGVTIHLKTGSDSTSVDTIRGMSLVYAVCDEVAFWRDFKYAWESVIMPALADQRGGALMISSPNGYDFFYDLCNRGLSTTDKDKMWSYHHADYTKAFNKEEVAELAEDAKSSVDPITYAREWMADFNSSGKLVYYSMNRTRNVDSTIKPFDSNEIVNIGLDFNIGIMSCIEWRHTAGQAQVVSETFGARNTEELCIMLRDKYPKHKIVVYPDPSGNARKTSAAVGQTDFSIIQSFGMTIRAKKSTQSIKDGVNSVNGMLCNSKNESNLFIHPDCKHLIESLEKLAWKEDTTSAVYSNDEYSHFADALRYPIDFEFSLNKTTLRQARIGGL